MSETTLYTNEFIEVRLPRKGAVQGHLIVVPRRTVGAFKQLSHEESLALFSTANTISKLLFEAFKSQGTNIVAYEDGKQLRIDILARREGDGLRLQWEPTELDESAMDDALQRIKDRAFFVGKQAQPAQEKPVAAKVQEDKSESPVGEHLLRALRRIP